jgi:hypothetical protein
MYHSAIVLAPIGLLPEKQGQLVQELAGNPFLMPFALADWGSPSRIGNTA